jgi:hypothetical protein
LHRRDHRDEEPDCVQKLLGFALDPGTTTIGGGGNGAHANKAGNCQQALCTSLDGPGPRALFSGGVLMQLRSPGDWRQPGTIVDAVPAALRTATGIITV